MSVGGFHVCNPYCGKCKPPKEMPLVCTNEDCKKLNDPTQGDYTGFCKFCGAELPPRNLPEPIFCLLIEQDCANPCGRGRETPPETADRTCEYHTPLS